MIAGNNGHRRVYRVFGVLLFAGTLLAACQSTNTYPRPAVTLPPTTVISPPSTDVTVTSIATDDISVATTDDLVDLVAAAQPGSSFVLESGVHRPSPVVPKDGMTFSGLPGAIMSGAIVLEGFTREGERWYIEGVEFSPDTGGECISGYESCGKPNDLFFDGVMLWRVDTDQEVEPGEWWGDDGRIVIADDPTNRVVEMSVEPYAFIGAASDVTIRDLVVEMYAVPSQNGAIQAQEMNDGPRGERWVIENVEIRNNHAVGLRTGNATQVINVYAHDNGQLGIAVSGGDDVLITDSELARNNTRGYLWEWEGGGGKFTRTRGLVVRRTISRDNLGPGLWTDIDAVDTLYESNTVTDNLGPGIFHEISGDAIIRDNDVSGNGFGKQKWAWGAGILIAASFDVEVSGNRVYDNTDGIAGVQQERGEGPLGPRLLDRLYVHDNDVRLPTGVTGVVQDVGDLSIFTERDIRFESNRYEGVGRRTAYAWGDSYLTWDGWVAVGQDVDGSGS